ncbi:MAG TPA: hypothetical protein VGD22_02205 [Sphingobacteriaceae bacterium]
MKTPKKIAKPGAKNLDVENKLTTPEPTNSKHVIDDEEEFDDELDDLGDFDDLSDFDDDDDEY